ncbi:MAG: redoxin domain-containing protein [Gammaproteobacteria bacterium]|jgi:peroxiredoxin|nr:redoxin domain-containing protein [Gammaproteobacteria bacterium]MCH1551612.1 redoxin domain-containing protein [Pseudomonadales bacterium]
MIKRLLACVTALLLASSVSAAPNVGDKAPDWVLAGSDGQMHTLQALRGKHVVIAFFPKAYTGG